MPERIYDVIVIGGGAGGIPAAIRASQLGAHVALVECKDLGGLCMNRGCIPFGQMMAASQMLGDMGLGKDLGLAFSEVSRNYAVLKKRQDTLIAFMGQGVKGTLKKNRVDVMKGRGKMIRRGVVRVEDKTVSGKNIILATGAKWLNPEFPGANSGEVINSDNLIALKELPKRVLLYGKGSWIIQAAQFLCRFGSQVILMTEEKRLLPDESRAITSRLKKVLKREGIAIKTKGCIAAATVKDDGLHVDCSTKDGHETVVVDRIMTLERSADLKGLGLKAVGLDEDGAYLRVNDRMETGVKGVYAIGDLTAPQTGHYSHLAAKKGIIAAENAMGEEAAMNPQTLTRVLFTAPQVACVGLTSKEAKKAGYDVVIGNAPLAMNPLGMIMSENEGMVEVVAEKRYGELLGVHVIGKNASEIIGQAVLAIQMEATVEELSRVSSPHPTLSESLSEAARDALGSPIYLP